MSPSSGYATGWGSHLIHSSLAPPFITKSIPIASAIFVPLNRHTQRDNDTL